MLKKALSELDDFTEWLRVGYFDNPKVIKRVWLWTIVIWMVVYAHGWY